MKLIYSYFNKQTGESTVVLADKYGRYTGKAKCHPDDKQYISEFMGCSLAEQRALIKSLKNKIHITKIKLNTAEIIFKDANNNHHSSEKNIALQYIKNYKAEIKKNKEIIKEIEFEINKRIEIRNNIINKIQKPAE